MDALTQCIEPYTCNVATPLTDALAADGIRRAARSLQRAYTHGQDTAARADMAYASLMGGLALANAKLGVVHGFASVLGGMYSAPHGAICAALLPVTMDTNIRALQARQPDSDYLRRYQEIARWMLGNDNATLIDGVECVKQLAQSLAIPPLRAYGITEGDFPKIVELTAKASSTKGNPITLTTAELAEILAAAL
jgi:alcohol dehydrogenase class IV